MAAKINSISGLGVLTEVIGLFFPINQLTTIDLSENTTVEDVELGNNLFENIDISENIALHDFSCQNNTAVTSLDISNNTELDILSILGCDFSALNTSSNTSLITIFASNNTSLSTVDFSNNPLLTSLQFSNCNLTAATISQILIDLNDAGLEFGQADFTAQQTPVTFASLTVGGQAAFTNLTAVLNWTINLDT